MKVINVKKKLFIILLCITPLLNFFELQALLNNKVTTLSIALTPIYIKILKEFIIFIILFIFLLEIIKKFKLPNIGIYYFLIFLFTISMLISSINENILLILAGIKWMLPVIFFIIFFNAVDYFLIKKIVKILIILIFLEFFLQIIESLYFPHWFGTNFFGLNLRNPGFFIVPNTAALFYMCSFIYIFFFYEQNFLQKIILYIIVPIGIYLTASGTGIIILFTMYFILIFFKIKQKISMFLLFVLSLTVIFFFLPEITGRKDIYISFLIRVEIFYEKLSHIMFFSTNFGKATNSAVLIGEKNAFIADNMITSLLYNIGFVGTFLFFIILIFIFKPLKAINLKLALMLYSIIIFSSLTTIIISVFPVNYLIVVLLIYGIKYNIYNKRLV